jgi:anti-sigma regulatory factor (Ser/Thr protein kinase)
MKSFYAAGVAPSVGVAESSSGSFESAVALLHIRTRARVAVYEASGAAPRVEDIEPAPVDQFIESLTTRVYELAREQGGAVPYTAIREVAENFIHADFAEPVVSVLDSGMTIRFADQGPGISDKDRAVMPGFTTANGEMKRYIRGVGSGLPIVRDYLSVSGGALVIEDNLGGGSVVTLYAKRSPERFSLSSAGSEPAASLQGAESSWSSAGGVQETLGVAGSVVPRLSTRQKQVLALVMESGSAGPSLVARELGCGVSTAYRDLASLEELDLICSDGGKRTLTERGLTCFENLVTR